MNACEPSSDPSSPDYDIEQEIIAYNASEQLLPPPSPDHSAEYDLALGT